jgi:hypothetical protein
MIILLGYMEDDVLTPTAFMSVVFQAWLLTDKFLLNLHSRACSLSSVLEYRNEEKSNENGKFKQEKCRWV